MVSLELPSFAKVNLSLRILGKREDGLHEVFTVMQTVSLHDTLRFELLDDEIILKCEDPSIPGDKRNIIYRAADLMRARFDLKKGVSISLTKRIPSPGGLGGGSSNAAISLLALNKLWNINATSAELGSIAAELGSDVPFFLYGGTALASGTGTIIEIIDDIPNKYLIIVRPDVHVRTAEAYAMLSLATLTNSASKSNLTNYRSVGVDGLEMVNDFEKTVFLAFPEIERVKDRLLELKARNALMSGSGSSVFGIFDNEETRQTALKALGEETNWRSFAVAAVSRSEYRDALKEVI